MSGATVASTWGQPSIYYSKGDCFCFCSSIVLSYVYSKQPILGLTQEWFRETRLEYGVHDRFHISSAWGAVAEWVRALACTDDRTVRDGFESHCGQLRFGTLAIPFTPLCQCLSEETLKAVLSGVYARGSKRFHQSALDV